MSMSLRLGAGAVVTADETAAVRVILEACVGEALLSCMIEAVTRGTDVEECGVGGRTSLKPRRGASMSLITFVPHLLQNLEPDLSEAPHSEQKRLIFEERKKNCKLSGGATGLVWFDWTPDFIFKGLRLFTI